jgi:hypothetical protein
MRNALLLNHTCISSYLSLGFFVIECHLESLQFTVQRSTNKLRLSQLVLSIINTLTKLLLLILQSLFVDQVFGQFILYNKTPQAVHIFTSPCTRVLLERDFFQSKS